MVPPSDDPRSISVIAVTANDVIAALEARRQRSRPVVLRVTPPFSGRMRARLHVAESEPSTDEGVPGSTDTDAERGPPEPLHVDPRAFVGSDAPPYPRPADTGDALRADSDADYTVDRHHDRHRAAVASWRDRVRDHFVAETTIETDRAPVRVDVVVLG